MKKIRISVLLVFFISFLACAFAQEPDLKIHFIDVREGDSILIEASDGETALVDAGNFVSSYRVIEYLKKNNIQSLDYLIFTHPHLDHIGGVFFVLQMIDVENIYDNGQDLAGGIVKSIDIYRWYGGLVRSSNNYKALKAGDGLLLGDITLSVLWPPQPSIFSDFNANSLVIMLNYRGFRCLLTGDLTSVGERKLLEQGINLKADVLKVGHHGAGDATCQGFLRAVFPKTAIISINASNIRGYPSAEVVDRLKKAGIKLYRTDRDGDIVLSIYQPDKGDSKIKVEKNK